MSREAVDGRKVLSSVKVPQDLAGLAGIGPQVAVKSTRKDHARNGGYGCQLGRTAMLAVRACDGCGSMPDLVAIAESEREQATTLFGI